MLSKCSAGLQLFGPLQEKTNLPGQKPGYGPGIPPEIQEKIQIVQLTFNPVKSVHKIIR